VIEVPADVPAEVPQRQPDARSGAHRKAVRIVSVAEGTVALRPTNSNVRAGQIFESAAALSRALGFWSSTAVSVKLYEAKRARSADSQQPVRAWVRGVEVEYVAAATVPVP
jgi:hypothetical protein